MDSGVLAGDAGWQDAEIACASLHDQRLGRRLRRLPDQLSSAPGQPVPAACGDWTATKAAYRFFDNPCIWRANFPRECHLSKVVYPPLRPG